MILISLDIRLYVTEKSGKSSGATLIKELAKGWKALSQSGRV